MIKNDWHRNVYKKKMRSIVNKDEWFKLKTACLKRDKFTCQRCEMVNSQGRGLTAHHITPRSEEGADEIHNLITLCDPCHDYVEINNLRSKAAIEGSYEIHVDIRAEQTKEVTEEGYHFTRPAWHRWVYGGGKKPE